MNGTNMAQPELPNLVTLLEKMLKNTIWASYLVLLENIIFSVIIILCILSVFWLATRKKEVIPGRLQSAVEIIIGGLDDFVCGIMGPKGRRFVPFIGTLFIYILSMNLFGLIPFMKSSTSSWSVTLGLALCVFVYVEYTAIKEFGFLGYIDVLMGKPRGFIIFSVFIPLLMLFIHIATGIIRPITLSLRLRSNIWGDDMLLAVLANFGLGGVPLLLFSTFLAIIAAVVQAGVFCLLTTIYFSLIILEKE